MAQSGELLHRCSKTLFTCTGYGRAANIGITLFGNKILPKSGKWMNTSKTNIRLCYVGVTCVFTFSYFCLKYGNSRLWAGLATVFLFGLRKRCPKNGCHYVIKIISFALAMVTVQPLQNWIWQTQTTTQSAVENMPVSQEQYVTKLKILKNLTAL